MAYLYPSLLFAHVVGAVGLFAAIAVEAVALAGLRRAEAVPDARRWLDLLSSSFRVGPPAMIAILASGIGMMAMSWGHQAWLVAAFVGLAAMGALGGLFSMRHVRRLGAALASAAGPELPDAFRAARDRAAPRASLRLRLAIGAGILALMAFKPGAAGSTLVLAAATLAGVASFSSLDPRRSAPAEPIGAGAAPRA